VASSWFYSSVICAISWYPYCNVTRI